MLQPRFTPKMIINVTNVVITNATAPFSDPIQFRISLECLPPGIQDGKSGA